MTIDEMIEEAYMNGIGRYTLSSYNMAHVADLSSKDWGVKNPEWVKFVPFIAGAIYEKLKSFQRSLNED